MRSFEVFEGETLVALAPGESVLGLGKASDSQWESFPIVGLVEGDALDGEWTYVRVFVGDAASLPEVDPAYAWTSIGQPTVAGESYAAFSETRTAHAK